MRGPRLVSKYRISPSCSYEPKMPFGTVDREVRPSRSSCPSANTADEPGAGSLREASPAAGKVVAHRATRHKHGTALERKVLRAANILTSCVDVLYDPLKDRTLNALSQYAVVADPSDGVATDLREVVGHHFDDRAQSVFEKAMRRSENRVSLANPILYRILAEPEKTLNFRRIFPFLLVLKMQSFRCELMPFITITRFFVSPFIVGEFARVSRRVFIGTRRKYASM